MKYLEVKIETVKEELENIETALLEIGLTDYVINDPDDLDDLIHKEKGYEWDYIDDSVMELGKEKPSIVLYFDGDECGNGYKEVEQVDLAIMPFNCTMTTSLHDDSEWKDNWKEYFKPKKVSERIVVKPTWEEYEKKDDEIVLEIDPGMAFGTGTHETTSLCIKALEEYMKEGDEVLDVGCGSGILSIAAALLGAKDVLGIEIDPVAVDISKENILLNHVENVAKAQYGDLTKGVDYKADIVVANLMADLVMMLTDDVAKHMKPGAKFISSGILDEKLVTVADYIRGKGFAIDEVKQDGMWCAIVAHK